MSSFDDRLMSFLEKVLGEPKNSTLQMQIHDEFRKLMDRTPNAGLIIKTSRIEIVARTDLLDLIVEVRKCGRLVTKSAMSFQMVKTQMMEDFFVKWTVQ